MIHDPVYMITSLFRDRITFEAIYGDRSRNWNEILTKGILRGFNSKSDLTENEQADMLKFYESEVKRLDK